MPFVKNVDAVYLCINLLKPFPTILLNSTLFLYVKIEFYEGFLTSFLIC